MTKTVIGVVAALVVVGAGWFWYSQGGMQAPGAMPANDGVFGTYAYSCNNGTQFDMTLYANEPKVTLKARGQAPFSDVVLQQSGSAYATEDGEVVLVGEGETITLTVGAATMICNPIPDGDNAPFSWGNEAEGSAKPDARLVVGETIMGTWQDNGDPKFVREFKAFSETSLTGQVIDRYDGKEVSAGTYTVFSKEAPIAVAFPLEDGTLYIQLTMAGSQADKLHFKLSMDAAANELVLTYMDRGGATTFKRVN